MSRSQVNPANFESTVIAESSHTESIGVLHPIDACRGLGRCSVHVYIVEDDVGGVHHVDCPELRLDYVEALYSHVADVPQYERHWTPGTSRANDCTFGLVPLVVVPNLTVSIDPSCAVAVDSNVVSCQDEACSVVLEFDAV